MAVKSTLGDMHMMLMEQLERLNECEPGSDEQKAEIARSNAMAALSKQVVANASIIMQAAKATSRAEVPRMLTAGDDA